VNDPRSSAAGGGPTRTGLTLRLVNDKVFRWRGGRWTAVRGSALGVAGSVTEAGTAGANHAAIAVAYLSDGETLVDAHNTDSYHFRWDMSASGATYYLDRMHDVINFY
jgi:hypothetical protein